ncbi:MAG: lipopolysaccharide assembly protein LapA domain-containing protein [Burkholderiaceae bacterium]|jgi:lipopolysaccharide assembly protein A|nr:lipopolysaccharide assembly protein LapA domain-containing protein [Burkholderiaceae bacterium]
MKVIFWFVRIVVFLAVLAFALNNQHAVDLYVLPGATWHTPLVWAVAGAFVLGTVFGVLAMLPVWLRARKLAKLYTKQQAKQHPQPNALSEAPPSGARTDSVTGSTANRSLKGVANDELGV